MTFEDSIQPLKSHVRSSIEIHPCQRGVLSRGDFIDSGGGEKASEMKDPARSLNIKK